MNFIEAMNYIFYHPQHYVSRPRPAWGPGDYVVRYRPDTTEYEIGLLAGEESWERYDIDALDVRSADWVIVRKDVTAPTGYTFKEACGLIVKDPGWTEVRRRCWPKSYGVHWDTMTARIDTGSTLEIYLPSTEDLAAQDWELYSKDGK